MDSEGRRGIGLTYAEAARESAGTATRSVSFRRPRAVLGLVAWIGVCLAIGFLGSLARPDAWYAGLAKPFFNPPDALFGPVWTVLYVLIAFAAWRIWERRGFGTAGLALVSFGAQLLVNGLWAPLFFGLHAMAAALVDLMILWLLIWATWALFRRLDQRAAAWLLPYWLWVSFAGVLNAALLWLNR
jgi:tryptophan-rich sensory protein